MPRNGQWVKYEGRVGIWYKNAFHATDEKGLTTAILMVSPTVVVPVTDVKDIPAPRRTHLPKNYNPHTKRVEEKAK